MKFVSTRDPNDRLLFSQAIQKGLSANGGLYVPEAFPQFSVEEFRNLQSLPEFAAQILNPFLKEDPLFGFLNSMCQRAFNFPLNLKTLKNNTAVLELFHGPTAAFKDFGARFLAECFDSLRKTQAHPEPLTVIVATSGDTGGAVAAAFFEKPGVEVFILFPQGKISARQEKQLTSWGGNVEAFSVRGTFDDCQRVVKAALADKDLVSRKKFVSANSISLGRLLPQMVYHAKAATEYYLATGRKPTLIVPTGNLGNGVAAIWARACGFPINQVVFATNANKTIPQFLQTGQYHPLPTVSTLANAMDVGNPSNVERLRAMFPQMDELNRIVSSISVSDQQITEIIRHGLSDWGEIWCPHTATAVFVREQMGDGDFIVEATAHPAKFETIVEPLIHQEIPMPRSLASILNRSSQYIEIDPTVDALRTVIR